MFTTRLAITATAILAVMSTGVAWAEEDNVAVAKATASKSVDPATIDRDGKRICGYELMTDSERGGHRSMLHSTKSIADRDAIRDDLCTRMQKRAQEKGVKLEQ